MATNPKKAPQITLTTVPPMRPAVIIDLCGDC
jgi:hypothetical protein